MGFSGNGCIRERLFATAIIGKRPGSWTALSFPYKEEVGGSSPSTPTKKTPVTNGGFRYDGLRGITFATPIRRESDTLAPDRSASRRPAAASSMPGSK